MVERHEANRRLRAKSFRSTDRAGALQWAITQEAAREMREEEARLESLRASLEGGAPQALLMRSNSLPVLPPVRCWVQVGERAGRVGGPFFKTIYCLGGLL